MRKDLSKIEEIVRQKTLQILRNTPNKEQAASMIARQISEVVRQECEPLKKAMVQVRDELSAREIKLVREREELERKTKEELSRLEQEMEEEDESGEEWKSGGALNR